MTSAQMSEWLGFGKARGVEVRAKNMRDEDGNPLVISRNITCPWRTGRTTLILNTFGAIQYNKFFKTRIVAPDEHTRISNHIHAIGLIDIGLALKKLGIEFNLEYRVNITEDQKEYIRPDVFYKLGGRQYIIEFERSRELYNLHNRLVERFYRWQNMLRDASAGNVSSDIIVLFSLDPDDRDTLCIWMKALHTFIQEAGEQPAFNIWFMSLTNFLNDPTLDLDSYKRLIPSDTPVTVLLDAERERFFAHEAAVLLREVAIKKSFEAVENYWTYNNGRMLDLQSEESSRRAFLDVCDSIFKMAHWGRPADHHNGSIPWLGVNTLRFWLERPELSDLRIGLIDALREYNSAYARGVDVAAKSLERMVWTVFLHKFGIGKDGPLSFFAYTADPGDKDNGRGGIFPVFSIRQPWCGRCDSEQMEATTLALGWLVDTLITYINELGLNKENKNPISTLVVESSPEPTIAEVFSVHARKKTNNAAQNSKTTRIQQGIRSGKTRSSGMDDENNSNE